MTEREVTFVVLLKWRPGSEICQEGLIRNMTNPRTSSALRALTVEYRSLLEEPVEGFCVKLLNDDNLFEWEVAIFGPPDTLYMGGYFKVSGDRASETNKRNKGADW